MKLSIIIVSWNVHDRLQNCLESIYHNHDDINLEVFVVDNGSKDGSNQMVKDKFPQVILIANESNQGFARANNQALKLAQGKYILFLNPDTLIFSGTLAKSVNFIAKTADCGLMGCKILNSNKSIQPSVRKFPHRWPIFLILTKLPKLFNFKSVNNYLSDNFDYQKTTLVDQVMGAFMMMPKSVIDCVGVFDDKFFLWFEEVDLCRRVWDNQFKVYYNSEPEIIHYGGSSFSQQIKIKNQWRFFRSAWYYFKKHGQKHI